MNSVEKIMYDEAEREFQYLDDLELGSEEHARGTSAANSIIDRLNKSEEIKLKNRELDFKEAELNMEKEKLDIEKQKLEVEVQKNKNGTLMDKVKIGVEIGTAMLFVVASFAQMKSSQRFESEGYTHTTESGRASERRLSNLIDKVIKRR